MLMVRALKTSIVRCMREARDFSFVEGESYFMSPTEKNPHHWIVTNQRCEYCVVSNAELRFMRDHFIIVEVDQSACTECNIELEDGLLASWLD